jgi:hypothetical protein
MTTILTYLYNFLTQNVPNYSQNFTPYKSVQALKFCRPPRFYSKYVYLFISNTHSLAIIKSACGKKHVRHFRSNPRELAIRLDQIMGLFPLKLRTAGVGCGSRAEIFCHTRDRCPLADFSLEEYNTSQNII